MNKSVLIIGGAGFLGQAVSKALSMRGVQGIGCADRHPTKIPGIENTIIDVLNPDSLERACRDYPTIINCIGQVTFPITACFKLNTEGVHNIATVAAKNGQRIIHISTVSVYGTTNQADESTPLNPETPYSACKAFAEYTWRQMIPAERLTILRLSNLYSENQPKGVIAYLRNALNGIEKLQFNNNGKLRRYYLHIDDCASVIADIAYNEKIHGVFNVLGHEQYTLRELIDLFKKITNYQGQVEYSDQPPLENISSIDDAAISAYVTIPNNHSVSKTFYQLVKAAPKSV